MENWTIDGVPAGLITRDLGGSRYAVRFDRNRVALADIEGIDWSKPAIERKDADANAVALPEGYGFELVEITYTSLMRQYTAVLAVAKQNLGDVTGYREELAEANAAAGALRTEIASANAAAAELESDLEQAYELLYGGDEA